MTVKARVYDKEPKGFFPEVEAVASYVNVDGRLLFLKLASGKEEKGFWGVPAGKLEAGETAVQGAKRELFEETGIEVSSEEVFQTLGKLYVRKPGMDYVYHLFGVHLDSLSSIHLSEEHCDYQWVLREEAENLPLMSGAREALDAYYRLRH